MKPRRRPFRLVSEASDGRIRLDFMNGRPDSIDVLIKARRRPGS